MTMGGIAREHSIPFSLNYAYCFFGNNTGTLLSSALCGGEAVVTYKTCGIRKYQERYEDGHS